MQVLLLKRSSKLSFAAGQWVFPGGKVDKADMLDVADNMEGLRRAAIRETREETSLHITEPLTYFMEFTTPKQAIRFRTSFFITRVEHDLPVVVDGSEIVDYQWQRPDSFLKAFEQQKLSLMVPTGLTMMRLAGRSSADTVISEFAAGHQFKLEPEFVSLDDSVRMTVYPGDELHSDTPHLAGCQHRCIFMDGMRQWRYIHNTNADQYPRLDGGYQGLDGGQGLGGGQG